MNFHLFLHLFNCNNCNNELILSSNQISKNRWCDDCPKIKIKIIRKINNILTFKKSFASHEKSKLWSNINNIQPSNVKKWCKDKFWFNCDNCSHNYEKSIVNIMLGSLCDYCCEPAQKLCNNEKCEKCFNKSFASSEKAKYWSNKNKLTPRNVFNKSGIKYIFDCNKCNNDFVCSLDKINNNRWCPYCKNKTELILYEKLKNIYPELEQQYKIDWCRNLKTKKYLPFDFVLNNYKIIIELDGLQHFKQVSNWKSPNNNLINDKYKMNCANNNNYSIIRILQDDVYNNSYDWLNELDNNIKKIIKENKIQNIFLCKNNEYTIYH